MTPKHGLSLQTLARVGEVLRRFPEVEKATLFGSRAKGTHRPGSDIDLALAGQGLDWRTISRIDDALDELLLPYNFSLIRLDAATDPDVAAHVGRVGVLLFDRNRELARR